MGARSIKPPPKDRSAFDLLLSSSLANDNDTQIEQGGDAQWVPLNRIRTKIQPRRYFDEQKLNELADSFAAQGFKGAINVRPLEDGTFELIAGERRYRAARLAGLDKVRCLIDEYTDEDALRFALAENMLREDLSKLEEIEGLLDLIELEHRISREQIIKLIQSEGHHRKRSGGNVSPSAEFLKVESILKHFGINVETFRTKYLKGLSLPPELKNVHMEGRLSFNSALELGKVKDSKARSALLQEALNGGLSCRDIQQKARSAASSTTSSAKPAVSTSPFQGIGEAFKRLKQCKGIKTLTTQQERAARKIQALIEVLVGEIEGGVPPAPSKKQVKNLDT
jgi:ParB family chromosome partitioning protein